jgi:hypothetical protein
VELHVLARGDVAHATPVALAQAPDRPHLVGGDGAAGELHPQHEVAVRILARAGLAARRRPLAPLRVEPVPAEELEVVGVDRVEAELGVPVDVGEHVEAVLARLDALDGGQLAVGDGGHRRASGTRAASLDPN